MHKWWEIAYHMRNKLALDLGIIRRQHKNSLNWNSSFLCLSSDIDQVKLWFFKTRCICNVAGEEVQMTKQLILQKAETRAKKKQQIFFIFFRLVYHNSSQISSYFYFVIQKAFLGRTKWKSCWQFNKTCIIKIEMVLSRNYFGPGKKAEDEWMPKTYMEFLAGAQKIVSIRINI